MIRGLALLSLGACASHAVGDGRAELMRARAAAASEDPSAAIPLFRRVPRFSLAWPRALVESARELARRPSFALALGELFTLRAPQLADWVFPEAYAIEADIYASNCYFGRARSVAAAFDRDILPLREAVAGARASGMIVPRSRSRSQSGSPSPSRFARWIATRLADPLGKGDRGQRLDALVAEIDAAKHTLDGMLDRYRESIRRVRDNDDVATPVTSPIIVTDEHVVWPFDGTFWPDELGFYRIPIRSACVPRGALWMLDPDGVF